MDGVSRCEGRIFPRAFPSELKSFPSFCIGSQVFSGQDFVLWPDYGTFGVLKSCSTSAQISSYHSDKIILYLDDWLFWPDR